MELLTAIDLAGSVALLLWGVHMVQTGVRRTFGPRLNVFLERMLRGRLQAFATGLGVTAVLQSSTATGLMITNMAARAHIALSASLAVMLGANVGTTLIVQVLAFDVTAVAPALILAGVVLFRKSRGAVRDSGRVFIGLGLLLLALRQFIDVLEPYAHRPELQNVLGVVGAHPLAAVLLAAGVTWMSHSSVATVMLVASFASRGAIMPATAFALVLGANIGTSINPVLESDATDAATRRLPLGNLLLRAAAAALVLPFLRPLADWVSGWEGTPQRSVADFHTMFNLALAVVALPFIDRYARLLEKMFPDPPQQATLTPGTPLYLDRSMLDNAPQIAVANATREALRLCDLLVDIMGALRESLMTADAQPALSIRRDAASMGQLGTAIRSYLVALDPEAATQDELTRAEDILAFCTQLIHASDIAERNLLTEAQKLARQRIRLAQDLLTPVTKMIDRIHVNIDSCATILLGGDDAIARRLAAQKDVFREIEMDATNAYFERLRQTQQAAGARSDAAPSAHDPGEAQLDLLRDLKRVNSHIVAAAAYPRLAEQGALLPSRVQPPLADEGKVEVKTILEGKES